MSGSLEGSQNGQMSPTNPPSHFLPDPPSSSSLGALPSTVASQTSLESTSFPAESSSHFPWKPPDGKKNSYITYDPVLDPSTSKKSKHPSYRYNDFSTVQTNKTRDPRRYTSSQELDARRKKARKMKYMPYLTPLTYPYDRNTPGPPPPPPPSAILITRISKLTTFELIKRHFIKFGKVQEHAFEIDPFHGNPLGICWIRYVDEMPRSPFEDERVKSLENLKKSKIAEGLRAEDIQDGSLCAKAAVEMTNNVRIVPFSSVSASSEDGVVKVELDDTKKTKYKHCVKEELIKRKPKKPQPVQPSASSTKSASQSKLANTNGLDTTNSQSVSPLPTSKPSSTLPTPKHLLPPRPSGPLPRSRDSSVSSMYSSYHDRSRPRSPPPRPYSPLYRGRRSFPSPSPPPSRYDEPPPRRPHSKSPPNRPNYISPSESISPPPRYNSRYLPPRGRSDSHTPAPHARDHSRPLSLSPPPRGRGRSVSSSFSRSPSPRGRSFHRESSYSTSRSPSPASPGGYRRRKSYSRSISISRSPNDTRRRFGSTSPKRQYCDYSDDSCKSPMYRRSPSPLPHRYGRPPPRWRYDSPPLSRGRIPRRRPPSTDVSSDEEGSSSGTNSSGDERDKVYFHRAAYRRAPIGSFHEPPGRQHSGRREAIGPVKTQSSPNKLSQLTDRRRQNIMRLLVNNGFSYITFDASVVNNVARDPQRISITTKIKDHFAPFGALDVDTDSQTFYVIFDSSEGARRCHVVLNRGNFHGVTLTLTLNDPVHADELKDDNDTTRLDAASLDPETELIQKAQDMISDQLLDVFLKDYKNRVVAPRIRNYIANGLPIDQKASAASRDEGIDRPTDVKQPSNESTRSMNGMDNGTTRPSVRGVLNLPSFAKHTKGSVNHEKRSSGKSNDIKERSNVPLDSVVEDSKLTFQEEEKRAVPEHQELKDAKATQGTKLDERISSVPKPQEPGQDLEDGSKLGRKSKKRKLKKEIVFTSSEEEKNDEGKDNLSTSGKHTKVTATKRSKATKRPSKKRVSELQATEPIQKKEEDTVSMDVDKTIKSEEDKTLFEVNVPANAILDDSKKVPDVVEIARSPTPDPFETHIAIDNEDLYYARMALERLRTGKEMYMPALVSEEQDERAVEEEASVHKPKQHFTGCAKTEGYYKVSTAEKLSYLPNRNKNINSESNNQNGGTPTANVTTASTSTSNNQSTVSKANSRSARVESRRLVQGFEQHKKQTASDTDVLKFNQLKSRKKQLKFSRSSIHWYGLYSMESIPAGEMVIEYVGELVQHQVAERREKQYERMGIGSSYLFRVDDDQVVDATKKGNLGRLINHCCTPNCTARIITINGQKKIVIYAKTNIEPGDEITYDYHFPIEDEKIVCLCGSSGCRGYLN